MCTHNLISKRVVPYPLCSSFSHRWMDIEPSHLLAVFACVVGILIPRGVDPELVKTLSKQLERCTPTPPCPETVPGSWCPYWIVFGIGLVIGGILGTRFASRSQATWSETSVAVSSSTQLRDTLQDTLKVGATPHPDRDGSEAVSQAARL